MDNITNEIINSNSFRNGKIIIDDGRARDIIKEKVIFIQNKINKQDNDIIWLISDNDTTLFNFIEKVISSTEKVYFIVVEDFFEIGMDYAFSATMKTLKEMVDQLPYFEIIIFSHDFKIIIYDTHHFSIGFWFDSNDERNSFREFVEIGAIQ